MSINELSHETIEELCGALERVPTLNWKVLMRSRSFSSIYKEEDVALIGNSTVLIDDMVHREIKLHHLLDGLKEIGNNKAVSIIMKGNSTVELIDDMVHREIKLHHLLDGLKEIGNNKAVSIIMKGGQNTGLNVKDSGVGPPPTLCINRNQKYDDEKKYSNFSCQQRREQGETLGFPIQEECSEEASQVADTGIESSLNEVKLYLISAIFRCFTA